MPATFSHGVTPPTRHRSIITKSTQRASIMWRNGTMPHTYSPPAIGVDSAAVTRARPWIIVARRNVLQPEQPDILDAAADVDRLLRPPTLVDVAHQFDVRPDRVAHHAHAAHFVGRRSDCPGSANWVFISPKTLVDQTGARAWRLLIGQPAPQRARSIGRHPVATPAEQFPQRLLQRLALDVPQRDVDRRERQRKNPPGPQESPAAARSLRRTASIRSGSSPIGSAHSSSTALRNVRSCAPP